MFCVYYNKQEVTNMCGKVVVVHKEVQPFLLQGLKKWEYRGYNSAGVAIQTAQGCMQVCKQKGDLTCLQQQSLQGGCGMRQTNAILSSSAPKVKFLYYRTKSSA